MNRRQPGLNSRGVCLGIATAALLSLSIPTARAQAPAGDQGYSMIISGAGDDLATSVALGDAGDVYITGQVTLDDFPVTSGAYDDAVYPRLFVTRFHPDGSIAFTAALRGTRGEALAVDHTGHVYVAGIEGTPSKAFVAKLSPDGSTLLYRRLLGRVEEVATNWYPPGPLPRLSLAVSPDGTAYVGGTAVAGFTTTAGAYDGTLGGNRDGFIAVVDPQGELASATFLGGSGDDWIAGIVVDPASGAVTVTGNTYSADFPVSANTLAAAADGGAFVTRLTGATLDFSSVLGHESAARSIVPGATGPAGPAPGSVWITGTTASTEFPVTPGAYGHFASNSFVPRQQTFILQLSATGDLLYSSSLMPNGHHTSEPGNDESEFGSARALSVAVADAPGRRKVYVAGESNTHRSYYDSYDDGFAFELDLVSNTGRYREQLGGATEEAFYGVAVNGRGDTVVVGFTHSFYTAYEFAWDGSIVYGTPVDGVPDEEMGDWIPSDIVLYKRVAPANTPIGSSVVVQGPDPSVRITFSNVLTAGDTTITPIADPSALGLTLPGSFRISQSSGAFEISTTATFSGTIEICLVASGLSDEEFATATVLHGVAGAWQPETTRRNPATRQLCADVTSLSPFAVGVLADAVAPQIECSPPPTGWQPGNVTVSCTASDSGSGLAFAGDASFTLGTAVGDGVETANAATDSRQVCDVAGNCAAAGPFGGIRVDRRAPAVQVSAPVARRYLLNEAGLAAYACSDSGSGLASCEGPVAAGAAIDTGAVGPRAFTVTAADLAGNAVAARVDFTVGYGIKTLYDVAKAYRAGSTVSLEVALVDAAGRNVSAGSITLVAQKLTHLADGTVIPLGYPLPFVTKSASYGGKVQTQGLKAGTYEAELAADGDDAVHRVRFTLK